MGHWASYLWFKQCPKANLPIMKVNKKFDKTEKNASKNQSIVNEKHVYDA